MKITRQIVLVIILLIIWLAGASANACIMGASWKKHREQADVVYSGMTKKITCIKADEIEVEFDVQSVWKGDIPQKYSIKMNAPCTREYAHQDDPKFWNSYNISQYIQENRAYLILGNINNGYLKPKSNVCGVGSIEINDELLNQVIKKGIPPYNSQDESLGLGQPEKIYN